MSWGDRSPRKGIVEVDLDAEPMDRAFLTLHEIEGRPRKRFPALDAGAVDDLTEAICRLAKGAGLEGAIVKVPVVNVTFERYGAIDRRRIWEAFGRALHLELEPEFAAEPAWTTPV